ncbi:MAG TPA: lipoprotein [Bacillaceae bacterium]
MKKSIAWLGLILLLSGCSSELSFSVQKKDSASRGVQEFVNGVKDENGIHLYLVGKKTAYVYLNGLNVELGEKAIHFTDFQVEEEGDTLNFVYTHDETADYSDPALHHERLYKVKLDKDYEYVKALGNGKEVSFGVVSGR